MIEIAEDVTRLLEDKQRAWPCHTNRSSSMGHPCTRHLVYARTSWDQASSIDPFLAGIFATGNVLEGPIERILSEAGEKASPAWRIVGGQQAIADELLKEHQITGHIDGLLQEKVGGGSAWNTVAVCDVKTCSDYTFDAIKSVDDLRKDKDTFFFKWYVQLQLYMLGMGIEEACIIMARKANLYDFKAIWFSIDYEMADYQLKRAKEINLAVAGAAMPAKINRPKVCNRCQFVHICNPRLELDAGEKFDDAETEALLDRRAELKEGKAEFDVVNKYLKMALPKGNLIRCGDWLIHSKLVEPIDKTPYWKRTYELMPLLPDTGIDLTPGNARGE